MMYYVHSLLFFKAERFQETHQRCVPGTGGACRELVQQEVYAKVCPVEAGAPPLADRVRLGN